jgi:peptidyl-tRNA hydrolase
MTYVMYCIVSREALKKMNGNRGKLAAQAGHAYLHAYWDAESRLADEWGQGNHDDYRRSGKAVKICLVVDTDDELRALEQAYRPKCGVSLVTDAGLTCFNGEPTITCLGIGPILRDEVGEDLAGLKVLI